MYHGTSLGILGDTTNKLPMNWRELRRISHLYHPVLVKNCLELNYWFSSTLQIPQFGFSLKEVGFCATNGHPKMVEFTPPSEENWDYSPERGSFQMIASPKNIYIISDFSTNYMEIISSYNCLERSIAIQVLQILSATQSSHWDVWSLLKHQRKARSASPQSIQ